MTKTQETSTSPSDTQKPQTPKRRWRTMVAWVLLILGIILTPITVVGVWSRNQLLDTDRYVATITPLASDPAIQKAIATSVSTNIFADNRVSDALQEKLPNSLDFLASPASTALQQATYKITLKAVEDKKFETVWIQANRVAHKSLENVLTGDGNITIQTKKGEVTIDLSPVYKEVSKKLEKTSFGVTSKIPFNLIPTDFVVARADGLVTAQGATKALNSAANILPWLILALFAGSIAAAKERRKAAFRVGLGLVVVSLLLAAALSLGRSGYVNAAATTSTGQAAQTSVYDITLRFLFMINRIVMLIGLVVVITAGVLGESRAAIKIRAVFSGLTNRAGSAGSEHGVLGGPISNFVAGNLVLLQSIVVVIAFTAFVFISAPSPMTVVWLALLTGVVEIVLLIVARSGSNSPAESAAIEVK
ncbi:MAG: hypothetical protein F2849_05485 [Actinobacteria bacterium]|nr:hypothetical protein [Actinomycetota bacterium]